jgi:hypothetical protein
MPTRGSSGLVIQSLSDHWSVAFVQRHHTRVESHTCQIVDRVANGFCSKFGSPLKLLAANDLQPASCLVLF